MCCDLVFKSSLWLLYMENKGEAGLEVAAPLNAIVWVGDDGALDSGVNC